jgi:DNA/RNA-binding domain of Phe-tRNA-synthetase-like protein
MDFSIFRKDHTMELRSEKLMSMYPAIPFGVLSVRNFWPDHIAAFGEIQQKEIAGIKSVFENYKRENYVKTEPICHYVKYFKRFKKTYFVLQQMESVFVKNLLFPETIPIVQAMFLTELKYGVLIAACDTEQMKEPYSLDVAKGGESYVGSQGKIIILKDGDIFLQDAKGIVVSNIYGQDMRTRVTGKTKDVMFVIMGVEGVSRTVVEEALANLQYYLQILDGSVESATLEIIG